MNTQNLKAKLLLTYAHLGVEEAERLAQRDVERTQAYKDSLKYNLDWIKEQGGKVVEVNESTIQYEPKIEKPLWRVGVDFIKGRKVR